MYIINDKKDISSGKRYLYLIRTPRSHIYWQSVSVQLLGFRYSASKQERDFHLCKFLYLIRTRLHTYPDPPHIISHLNLRIIVDNIKGVRFSVSYLTQYLLLLNDHDMSLLFQADLIRKPNLIKCF